MPSLDCRCGQRIAYGQIPCPDEWLFISDTAFDGFSGQVDAEAVYGAMNSFLKCPNCRRLWVFWNGFSAPPEEYLPGQGVEGKPAPSRA